MESRELSRVVVIGAGIAGLSAGFRLMRAGVDVSVVERASHAGGHMRTLVREGWRYEQGPNSFLSSATPLFELAREVGLEPVRASEHASRRYVFVDGKLQELHASPRLLASPILPLSARFRLLAEALIPGKHSQEESVREFFDRRLGSEVTARLVDAFVSGIYAGDIDHLGMAAAFPKVWQLVNDHGSIVGGMLAQRKASKGQKPENKKAESRKPENQEVENLKAENRSSDVTISDSSAPFSSSEADPSNSAAPSGSADFSDATESSGSRSSRIPRPEAGNEGQKGRGTWSFRNGLGELPARLAEALGTRLILEREVRLERRQERWWVDGEEVDAILLATPTFAASRLLAESAPKLSDLLDRLEYAPVAGIHLLIPKERVGRQLDGFGFLVPRREKLSFLGCIWNSALFPVCDSDKVALTVLCGGRDKASYSLSDEELFSRVLSELGPILDLRGPPLDWAIVRHDRAIPQPGRNHLKWLQSLNEELSTHPGLFLTGNHQGGVSMGETIAHAEATAQAILESLSPTSASTLASTSSATSTSLGTPTSTLSSTSISSSTSSSTSRSISTSNGTSTLTSTSSGTSTSTSTSNGTPTPTPTSDGTSTSIPTSNETSTPAPTSNPTPTSISTPNGTPTPTSDETSTSTSTLSGTSTQSSTSDGTSTSIPTLNGTSTLAPTATSSSISTSSSTPNGTPTPTSAASKAEPSESPATQHSSRAFDAQATSDRSLNAVRQPIPPQSTPQPGESSLKLEEEREKQQPRLHQEGDVS